MLYSYLNCDRLASEDEIRKSYKKISRIVHPDKSSKLTKESSEELFRKIEQAYSVLSCPIKRHLYDCYSDEGIEVYEANRSLFEPVKLIEDYESKFRKIEEIFLTLKNHKKNYKSLELLDSQKLKIHLSMVEYSSIYRGKYPYNLYSFFKLSSFQYETAAVLGDFGKLAFFVNNNGSGMKFSSRSTFNVFEKEYDFRLETDLTNIGNSTFELSRTIDDWYF